MKKLDFHPIKFAFKYVDASWLRHNKNEASLCYARMDEDDNSNNPVVIYGFWGIEHNYTDHVEIGINNLYFYEET